MQFTLPYIDILTIPSGAGPGDQRVVIDGTTGRIEIYDVNGDLIGYIDADNGYTIVEPGDPAFGKTAKLWIPPSTTQPALSFTPETGYTDAYSGITDNVFSSGVSKRYFLSIVSAILNGTRAEIAMYSGRSDSTDGSVIVLDADDIQYRDFLDPPGPNSARSFPRGEQAYVQATADDAITAGAEELFDICIINDLSVREGRKYKIEGQVSFSNVTTRTISRLRYTEDGSTPTTASAVMESAVFNTTAVGSSGGTSRINSRYIPSSDLDLSVGLFLQCDANITAFGANDQHGYIKVTDEGRI